ncbi:hypothetical protein FJT64_005144 [Amphibalanus amphitrite]|uniref:Uncharacterized protein n=1 Tax=Amphibalanus amphitrite TaxID=1232801 RepID=A0A6A4W6B6_AMPAM|nr:hypothetical protein FJT64_005144 [Amphibalanus amphitrite]
MIRDVSAENLTVAAENLTPVAENLTTVAENLTTAAASSSVGAAPICQWYSSPALLQSSASGTLPTTTSSATQLGLLLSDTVYLPEAHRTGTTSLLATLPAEAFCLDYSANPPGPINMTAEMLSSAESGAPPADTPPCSAAGERGGQYPAPAYGRAGHGCGSA